WVAARPLSRVEPDGFMIISCDVDPDSEARRHFSKPATRRWRLVRCMYRMIRGLDAAPPAPTFCPHPPHNLWGQVGMVMATL
ncbi:MAG: hypothetical protein AB8H79_04355, partial [Myxococcota bacterium]